MNEKDLKRILKPIYIVIEKLVPTNRSLLDFTNEKAVGSGMKRSVYKVKFLDKAEKSSYQVTSVTLVEFEKHLKGLQLGKADEEQLLREAGANILVAGTAIYKSTDVWASTALLKGE